MMCDEAMRHIYCDTSILRCATQFTTRQSVEGTQLELMISDKPEIKSKYVLATEVFAALSNTSRAYCKRPYILPQMQRHNAILLRNAKFGTPAGHQHQAKHCTYLIQ